MERKKLIKFGTAIILLHLVLLPISSGMSAEIYKWKDKDGNIFFSDTPPPPGVNTEIKKFKDEPSGKTSPKAGSPQRQTETVREKRPYSKIQVIMYMTAW